MLPHLSHVDEVNAFYSRVKYGTAFKPEASLDKGEMLSFIVIVETMTNNTQVCIFVKCVRKTFLCLKSFSQLNVIASTAAQHVIPQDNSVAMS